MTARTIIVLYNRDLRVRDHAALSSAVEQADRVVPLFVLDDALVAGRFGSANRLAFLLECLDDLRAGLRTRGGDLFVRRGETVRAVREVVAATGAAAVHASADWSGFAKRRERRLREMLIEHGAEFRTFPGNAVVAPGAVRPAGGDHYKVFTPYWRAWVKHPRERGRRGPAAVAVPPALDAGDIPALDALTAHAPSPRRAHGGETRARASLARWLGDVGAYDETRDALPDDRTSRLSAALHFGCISGGEAAARAAGRDGGEAWVRQLCWRDFHQQVLDAFPALASADYRTRGDRWRDAPEEFERWQAGRTGIPIVDAGMRQLLEEGFMHNRARMVVASFLTKHLYIDWRLGAAHFMDWLCDGDLAVNHGNWQWTAGTGNDTRPNRIFNPLRQAERFDPQGGYVRHWVAELQSIEGKAVHRPWTLGLYRPAPEVYPAPIVDLEEAAGRFRLWRGA